MEFSQPVSRISCSQSEAVLENEGILPGRGRFIFIKTKGVKMPKAMINVAARVKPEDNETWQAAVAKAKSKGQIWGEVLMGLVQEYLDREDD